MAMLRTVNAMLVGFVFFMVCPNFFILYFVDEGMNNSIHVQRCKTRQIWQIYLCYFSELVLIFELCIDAPSIAQRCTNVFTTNTINTSAISTSYIIIRAIYFCMMLLGGNEMAFCCYQQVLFGFIGHLRCFVAN